MNPRRFRVRGQQEVEDEKMNLLSTAMLTTTSTFFLPQGQKFVFWGKLPFW